MMENLCGQNDLQEAIYHYDSWPSDIILLWYVSEKFSSSKWHLPPKSSGLYSSQVVSVFSKLIIPMEMYLVLLYSLLLSLSSIYFNLAQKIVQSEKALSLINTKAIIGHRRKLINAVNFTCKWILLFPRSEVTGIPYRNWFLKIPQCPCCSLFLLSFRP